MNLWNYIHYTLGLHFWVLPTLIVIIAAAAVCIVHGILQKKRRSEHEMASALKYGAPEGREKSR